MFQSVQVQVAMFISAGDKLQVQVLRRSCRFPGAEVQRCRSSKCRCGGAVMRCRGAGDEVQRCRFQGTKVQVHVSMCRGAGVEVQATS